MRLIDADALKNAMVEKGQHSRRHKVGEFWELNESEIREVIDSMSTIEPEWTERCIDCKNFNKTQLLIPQPERTGRWINVDTVIKELGAECFAKRVNGELIALGGIEDYAELRGKDGPVMWNEHCSRAEPYKGVDA